MQNQKMQMNLIMLQKKSCVHMDQNFLTWVFRFAPMLGGYLILLLTVGSNFWRISESENHWFWFF
jgi:hypothetical protein